MTVTRKKLIEVALPLEAINVASAREKSIRHGHPSTLHLWWARRPLAAARGVIFSQMVDDPSEYVDELLADPTTRRTAEKAFRARLKAWEERTVVYDKAHATGMAGASNPVPGTQPTLEETAAGIERQRLFRILETLVLWESTTNEAALQQAREEIWRSWRRTCRENANHPRVAELFDPQKLPAFHDPFAGGGALPLEAQRLGMESYASDLNPVAVLINKAMIEIPPRFANCPPVNPEARQQKALVAREWKGVAGLAEDVRYYGKWMRDEAKKRIGHLYPKVEVTAEMAQERPDLRPYVGHNLTVIAWLWARTVKSPNPAFIHIDVPLISSYLLASKSGKEAYVQPVIDGENYHFNVKVGKPVDEVAVRNGTKLARGANFQCLMSGTPIVGEYIKAEGKAGRIGSRLMGIVAEGNNGRIYLSPTDSIESIARSAKPEWKPEISLPNDPRNFWTVQYGLTSYGDLFTPRQLVALNTYSDLVLEARETVIHDALINGFQNDTKFFNEGSSGAVAYADAVAVYLAFAVDRSADFWSTIATWSPQPKNEIVGHTFGRQAIPMTWDFGEINIFSQSGGNFIGNLEYCAKAIEKLPGKADGWSLQCDASSQSLSLNRIVSTDPPYYDNITYADLSDFFYVWLRRSLKPIFSELFSTLAVPKTEELIAAPYRHGSKEKAEEFFLEGMTHAMNQLSEQSHISFPVTIYYAFKQAESDGANGTVSTGWETFLDAIIRAGFALTGTWPIRTERDQGLKSGINALASSIVIVCRKRAPDAPIATRREFVGTLQTELPAALAHLQASNIAPVDLAQAAIGPGMAVYTRYSKVLDAQGQPLSVRLALALINQTLDEVLAEQEGEFDADTRWALAWFEQNGFAEGEYGAAETLSRAKDTSVGGMVEAGIIAAGRGKVRLFKPAELPANWNPTADKRLTTWEMVHQLIRVLEADGENGAAQLMAKLGAKSETARELCYRLYTLCERKKRAAEALSYNALVQSWPEIIRLAREGKQVSETQAALF